MYSRLFGRPKPEVIMMSLRLKSMLMMMLMCSAALAGCLGSEDEDEKSTSEICSGDELIVAYEIKEDMPADDI